MPFDFSFGQILIVLVIALLVFGPKRLPEMARQLGKGIGEFKQSVSDVTSGPSSVAPMSASPPQDAAPPAAAPPAEPGDAPSAPAAPAAPPPAPAAADLDALVRPGGDQPPPPTA